MVSIDITCRCFFFILTDFIQSGGLSWDFLTTLKINGCQEQCATEQHHLHPIDILSYHNHFTPLPRPARRQWVLDYLNTHSSHDTSSGEPVTIYLIGGKPVGQPLWIATLGISNSLYYEVRKLFQNGHVRITKEIQRTPLQRNGATAYFDLHQWPHDPNHESRGVGTKWTTRPAVVEGDQV